MKIMKMMGVALFSFLLGLSLPLFSHRTTSNSSVNKTSPSLSQISPKVGQPKPFPLKGQSSVILASWYGPGYQGRPTASGELFDSTKLTAASRTLKFNTNIRVCRLNSDTCVWLRITDRGPYVDGRDLDVSEAGATALGFHDAGLAKLRIVEMVLPQRKK